MWSGCASIGYGANTREGFSARMTSATFLRASTVSNSSTFSPGFFSQAETDPSVMV